MKNTILFLSIFLFTTTIIGQTVRKKRMSLNELAQDTVMLQSFIKGVEVMKSRKPSDPTSWFFQGAIHGVDSIAIAEAKLIDSNVNNLDINRFWNKCPHNGESSAAFLPWHRAYLHYFEEILRDASGNPDLALPYWDYSGAERAFPEIFANRGTESNPNVLYNENRELVFMFNLYELSDRVVTTDIIFNERNFFGQTERSGLAGAVYDNDSGTKGLIERQPHDLMHISIGGMIGDARGSMSAVRTAAFDPIFWVHHANIDKLWADWEVLPNRSWGRVPEMSWFDRKWEFYDKNKKIKTETISHWLKFKNMNYTYSTDSDEQPRLSDNLPTESKIDTTLFASPFLLAENLKSQPLSNNKSASYELSNFKENTVKFNNQNIDNPIPILEIEFSLPKNVPTIGYEVYVSVNEIEYSLGVLSFFGLEHHSAHKKNDVSHENMMKNMGFREEFEIPSELYNDILRLDKINVIIKPFDLYTARQKNMPEIQRGGNIEVLSTKLKLE